VKNLSNPEYLKIILNGHDSLEDRFAEIDEKFVRQQMKKRDGQGYMPSGMKKVLRKPDFASVVGRRSRAAVLS